MGQMSKLDVKNYLEKIYKVNTVDVTTHIQMGKMKRAKVGSYIVKEDDEKVAFVTLPKTEKFTFPVLFPEDKEEKEEQEIKQLATLKKEYDGLIKNFHIFIQYQFKILKMQLIIVLNCCFLSL